jgi:phospholipase C
MPGGNGLAASFSARIPYLREGMHAEGKAKATRGVAVFAVALLFVLGQPHASAQAKHNDITQIQHIILIIRENRTFDNMFGTFPGANGVTSATISTGQVISLVHGEDQYPRDPDHGPKSARVAIDSGKMDAFDLVINGNRNGDYLSLSQQVEADIPNYFAYARYFALGDQMFSSIPTDSYPAHLFTIAAQSFQAIDVPRGSTPGGDTWGCDAPPSWAARSETAQGIFFNIYPCYASVTTMADLLDEAGISWRSYAPTFSERGYGFNIYDAIKRIREGPEWTTNVLPYTQFAADAQAGNLPAVTWLAAGEQKTDHPPHSLCYGENWVVDQLNALMQGPDWDSTVVFIVWDDYGGVYDHVPPPAPVDIYGFGPRSGVLVISPWVKSGLISHDVFEFSSMLKFIETRFNLPSLTQRDAQANNMVDMFDFTQGPLPPLFLNTRTCPLIASTSFFGNVTLGDTLENQVNLFNNRSKDLTISSIKASADYSTSSNCGSSVPSMAQCQVNILFKPTAVGSRPGTLTITDSDPTSPQVIELNGTGTKVAVSTAIFEFGMVAFGKPSHHSFSLANKGSAALGITSITTQRDFSQTNNCPKSLPAGKSCNIDVAFSPLDGGYRAGVLTIVDSDPGSPHTIYFRGYGAALLYSPGQLTFAPEPVGQKSPPQVVTLTAYGSSPVLFGKGKVLATGDFAQTNTCPSSLSPGAKCHVTVTFTPTKKGTRVGGVVFNDSDLNSPNSVVLHGTGQ